MTTSPFDARPTQQAAQAAAPTTNPDASSFDLQIEADEPAYVTVNLVGKKYRVKAPKAALGLKLAVRAKQAEESPDLMAEAIDEWIGRAFSAEDAADVRYRMYESDDDPLDLPHVMDLMEKVIERTTGNPTS